MAVAMCAPPPPPLLPPFAVAASAASDSDRFYKFGTPSPPSVPEFSPPSCYSELEESGFHSDEEMQKVRLSGVQGGVFMARSLCKLSHARLPCGAALPAWESVPA